jgi:NAD(P)-dependent dehydrogenase (short-subunit alcohol dehydrogenase family)
MAEKLAQTPGNVVYAGARSLDKASLLQKAAEKADGRIQIVQLDTVDDASVKVSQIIAVLPLQFWQLRLQSRRSTRNKARSMYWSTMQGGSQWDQCWLCSTAAGGFNGPVDMSVLFRIWPIWYWPRSDLEAMASNFNVNVLGVARLTNAALPLMRKSDIRQIFVLSSGMGCPWYAKEKGPFGTAYAPTKSATTQLTVHYALALKDDGFTVVPVNPGWVRTEMGTEYADISVEESIDGLWVFIRPLEGLLTVPQRQGLRFREEGRRNWVHRLRRKDPSFLDLMLLSMKFNSMCH